MIILKLIVLLLSINSVFASDADEVKRIYDILTKGGHAYAPGFKKTTDLLLADSGKSSDGTSSQKAFCNLTEMVGGINIDACKLLTRMVADKQAKEVIANEKYASDKAKLDLECPCGKDVESDSKVFPSFKKFCSREGSPDIAYAWNRYETTYEMIVAFSETVKVCACWTGAEINKKYQKCLPQLNVHAEKIKTELAEAQLAAEREKTEQLTQEKEAAEYKKSADKLQAEADAKFNSKECKIVRARAMYCGNLTIARIQELVIQREKAIGKKTGYENGFKLNQAASTQLRMNEFAESIRKQYAEMGGKPNLSLSICKIVDGPYQTANPSHKLNEDVEKICGSLEQ